METPCKLSSAIVCVPEAVLDLIKSYGDTPWVKGVVGIAARFRVWSGKFKWSDPRTAP